MISLTSPPFVNNFFFMSRDEESIDLLGEENAEELLQDWGSLNGAVNATALHQISSRRNDESLPKRSEKFFDKDGSSVQELSLNSAQEQMYLALLHVRGHHSKQLLVGVWIESRNKAFVPHAKGSFFKDMGVSHAYPRKEKLQGMWLNKVESVYLVERGSLVMFLANVEFMKFMENDAMLFDYDCLTHMTLAHLYSTAFSGDERSSDNYKVFALLKRLGYMVMECRDCDAQCSEPQFPFEIGKKISVSTSALCKPYVVSFGTICRKLCTSFLGHRRHFFDFTLVFQSIAIETMQPSDTKLTEPPYPVDPSYRIVYKAWKPTPHFSKKTPPPADFYLGVLNTSKTGIPSLASIQISWEQAYKMDLALASKKNQEKGNLNKKVAQGLKKEAKLKARLEREAKLDPRLRNRNHYLRERDQMLKSGSTKTSVVYAIIDDGIVNFAAFNETDFKLRSSGILDELEMRESHGIIWNEKLEI